MRIKTAALAATLALAAITVSACRDGHPGHNSDRHYGRHDRGDHRR